MIGDWVTVMILLGAHGCDTLERTAPLMCLECLQKLDMARLVKRIVDFTVEEGMAG
jgi:hypothetical protein